MRELTMINGRVVPKREAMVPVDDWAFRYGWGLFETLRIARGCPLFLDRHLARMCGMAAVLELSKDPESDHRRWRREITAALAASRQREGIINCYWTGGLVPNARKQLRIVRLRPMPRYPRRPLRLWVAPWRLEPTYPGTGAKTLAYFPYIFAGVSARRAGFDEAVILNSAERVADGATSSLFLITKGRIATPSLDQGALAGIARSVVLEVAARAGIRCQERSVTWKMLTRADEVFLSSSMRGVVRVGEISGAWKSKRIKNSHFRVIESAFSEAVSEDISHWNQDV